MSKELKPQEAQPIRTATTDLDPNAMIAMLNNAVGVMDNKIKN